MSRIAAAAFAVALSLWTGGLVSLSFFAAPLIFRISGSRQMAGSIFGSILRAFHWAEGIAAVVAAASLVALLWPLRGLGPLDWIRIALLAAMIVLLVSYAACLHPTIAQIRPACGNFDLDAATETERTARARFDGLHRWSVRLVGANILLGLALIALTAYRARP